MLSTTLTKKQKFALAWHKPDVSTNIDPKLSIMPTTS